jgi:hypothetical protein
MGGVKVYTWQLKVVFLVYFEAARAGLQMELLRNWCQDIIAEQSCQGPLLPG